MNNHLASAVWLTMSAATMWAQQQKPQAPPRAGKPAVMRVSELKPGMQATAWTVFAGSEAEPVPVEIIGVMKNAWGPKQDIILGKMGGKAIRTNVAGGMSGSPVYIDGKLVGALARHNVGEVNAPAGQFSLDAATVVVGANGADVGCPQAKGSAG